MDEHLSIGELAKKSGVKVVTIRYYEQIGLLAAPERTEGNYRTYNRNTPAVSASSEDVVISVFRSIRFGIFFACRQKMLRRARRSAA